MNKLEVKDLSLMLDETDLENFKPKGSFCLVFNIDIGLIGEKAADEFRFSVCNKEWLAEYLLKDEEFDFLNNYNFLVIKEFSLQKIQMILNNKLDEISPFVTKKNWNNIALRLNEYFRWEYYNEYLHSDLH